MIVSNETTATYNERQLRIFRDALRMAVWVPPYGGDTTYEELEAALKDVEYDIETIERMESEKPLKIMNDTVYAMRPNL